MGKKFGNLGHLRGMIYQGISPFEQRAFAGAVSKGLPNLVKRFRTEVLFVVLPMAAVYAIYDWGEKKNHVLSRKNPADFINDE